MRLKILLILLICFPIIVFTLGDTDTKNNVDSIQDLQKKIDIIKNSIDERENKLKSNEELVQKSITFISVAIAVIGVIVVLEGFISFYKVYQIFKEYGKFEKDMEKHKKEQIKLVENRFDELKNNFLMFTVPGLDHLVIGNSELEKGHHEIAELHFRMEIIKKPQANALVGLARAYQGMNKSDEALKALEQAITLDKAEPKFNVWGQISVLKAETLIDIERYQEAKDVLQDEVLKKNPDSRKAKTLLELCNNKLTGRKEK
ncbi:MAG: hypothetical protein QG657_5486 [Acidobacteriota bacterium]|nr:hypothetical protein [Acidobacteriota bacterium]